MPEVSAWKYVRYLCDALWHQATRELLRGSQFLAGTLTKLAKQLSSLASRFEQTPPPSQRALEALGAALAAPEDAEVGQAWVPERLRAMGHGTLGQD